MARKTTKSATSLRRKITPQEAAAGAKVRAERGAMNPKAPKSRAAVTGTAAPRGGRKQILRGGMPKAPLKRSDIK